MKWIHIVAGLLSLASGFVALFAAKGGWLHRRSGTVFVWAMLVMTLSAIVSAGFLSVNRGNVVAATLTLYLVCTGLLTVRKRVEHGHVLSLGLVTLGLLASVFGFVFGLQATGHPSGTIDGIPAAPMFLFGFIGLLGVWGDIRQLFTGFLQGPARLARHLWRMSFALWIASASAFLGQAKFFPPLIRHSGVLVVPVLLVLIVLAYWLARMVRVKRNMRPLNSQRPGSDGERRSL